MLSVRHQRRVARAAGIALQRTIAGGAAEYERERQLPRLIPVGPAEIADLTSAGRRAILLRLARALRGERNRGRAGHWTYDLNRHIGLRQAYVAERRAASAAQNETAARAEGADGRRNR